MTTLEADSYGIEDRGALKLGLAADTCILDADEVSVGWPTRVHDRPAGARRLISEPTGIEYVIVTALFYSRTRKIASAPTAP
jgi:N-acyl-D-aspartate/D-glutamate deacylase